MNNIQFTDFSQEILEMYHPKPAISNLPDWYKLTGSYVNGVKKPLGDGSVKPTIKRCMPVFDALTGGYLLFTYEDIYITATEAEAENEVWYQWPHHKSIEHHPLDQAELHPNRMSKLDFPKWMNPWGIKTPPGYSCLFIPPVHRENILTIFPGIVDTDTYNIPVNFPFTHSTELEVLIPAGTPIVQVIPFKRDSWKMSFGSQEEVKKSSFQSLIISNHFFDKYKRFFRTSKEFK